jgi:hypothetical protein
MEIRYTYDFSAVQPKLYFSRVTGKEMTFRWFYGNPNPMYYFIGDSAYLIAGDGNVGFGRKAGLSIGDINNDQKADFVLSFGEAKGTHEYPNVVFPFTTLSPYQLYYGIGHPFEAFKDIETPAGYSRGEILTAIGNFTGQLPNQIAAAQGTGGNQVVRLFQYTGKPAPHAFQVVGQFYGLVAGAKERNARGKIHLSAGDLDRDGKDELIVSQSYSETSTTTLHVLDIDAEGKIERRLPCEAFPKENRVGNAGVVTAVADIDQDGFMELIAASRGSGVQKDGQMNLIAILDPIIENGTITGFSRPAGGIFSVFDEQECPDGFLTLTAGEVDGCKSNGAELLVANAPAEETAGPADSPGLMDNILKIIHLESREGVLEAHELERLSIPAVETSKEVNLAIDYLSKPER